MDNKNEWTIVNKDKVHSDSPPIEASIPRIIESSDLNANPPEWTIVNKDKVHSDSPPVVPPIPRIIQPSDLSGDISQWETTNVKDMSPMFKPTDFSNISEWDTSNVKELNIDSAVSMILDDNQKEVYLNACKKGDWKTIDDINKIVQNEIMAYYPILPNAMSIEASQMSKEHSFFKAVQSNDMEAVKKLILNPNINIEKTEGIAVYLENNPNKEIDKMFDLKTNPDLIQEETKPSEFSFGNALNNLKNTLNKFRKSSDSNSNSHKPK